MLLLNLTTKEAEELKEFLKDNDKAYFIYIYEETIKYKKGDFVKTPWGERLSITDSYSVTSKKSLDNFKYKKSLTEVQREKIQGTPNYKKIEILELKKIKIHKK